MYSPDNENAFKTTRTGLGEPWCTLRSPYRLSAAELGQKLTYKHCPVLQLETLCVFAVTWWVCAGCCCVGAHAVSGAQRRNLPSDSRGLREPRRWSPGMIQWREMSVRFHHKYRVSSPQGGNKGRRLTAKASSALWLSLVSSGLSTGVCLVNLVSNWLTSSSDCYTDTDGGRQKERLNPSYGTCEWGQEVVKGGYQLWLVRWLHSLVQQVIPVNVFEEQMFLHRTKGLQTHTRPHAVMFTQ